MHAHNIYRYIMQKYSAILNSSKLLEIKFRICNNKMYQQYKLASYDSIKINHKGKKWLLNILTVMYTSCVLNSCITLEHEIICQYPDFL